MKVLLSVFLAILILVSGSCKKEHDSNNINDPAGIQYFNGGQQDKVCKIEKTHDGGFIFCGYTTMGKNTDAFLLKCDADGKQQWYKTFGGAGFDIFRHAINTEDGEYLAVGSSNTFSFDTANAKFTGYVVKLDANGNLLWQKYYGSYETSFCYVAENKVSNSFLITGSINMLGGGGEINLLTIDALGNTRNNRIYNSKTLEGTPPLNFPKWYYKYSNSIFITDDPSTPVLLGGTISKSGAEQIHLNYVMSLSNNGNPQNFYCNDNFTTRNYRNAWNGANDISLLIPLKFLKLKEGYLVGTFIEDIQTQRMHMQIIKTNLSADIVNPEWSKMYSGLGNALLYDMVENEDGTFLLTGASSDQPINGAFPECFNGLKIMLLKVDSKGNEIWSRYLGSDNNANIALCTQPTADGGFAMAGYNSSNQTGFHKMFFMKLDENGKPRL